MASLLLEVTTPAFDVDTLTRLGRVGAVAPSPCGRWLAVAVARLDADDANYVSDLWRVSLADDGAEPLQLTRGEHSDGAPAFRPDGTLLFLSKRPTDAKDEDPRAQVWALSPNGGEPHPVTDEPLGVEAFRHEGARLVVATRVWPGVPPESQRAYDDDASKHGPSALTYTEMPARYWDAWIPGTMRHFVVHDSAGRRDLTPEARREYEDTDFDLGPDGRRLVVCRRVMGPDRIFDESLDVFDLEDGGCVRLGVAPRTTFHRPRFAPDGRRVVTVSHTRQDRDLGPIRLWLHDVTAPDDPGRAVAGDWDVHPEPHAWDGDHIVCTAGVCARVPVFKVSLAGDVERLTDDGSHEGLRVVPGGGGLVGVRHTLLHPPEPFRLRTGEAPRQLATLSGFEGADFARWTEFDVESDAPDGRTVRSFYVEPTAPAQGPRTCVLWIHGGPVGQCSDGWHWRWNPLVAVAAGYTVAQPNPRGSTGVDQAFIDGVWNNRWGAECYDDLMAVTDALAARPDVDGANIVAMGGSFGGYMTNWIGARTDRFAALVTHASIYHLPAFSDTTDLPAWFHLEQGCTPDDPEFSRYSPHRFVDAWRTPVLIIHGEKDYRVPISEALLLFEALQRRGITSELLVFPDENHWIMKPRNIRVWYRAWMDFVSQHAAR